MLPIQQLLGKLNLQPRAKAYGGGLFVYHDRKSRLFLTFRWDGAGLTTSGDIVLFEEEKRMFQAVHIHGHLSRLPLMVRAGESIRKLIWIISEASSAELDRIVFPFVRMWEKGLGARFPLIEYRSRKGTYQGPLGISEGKKMRRTIHAGKPVNWM